MDTEEPVEIQPPRRRFLEVLLGGGLFASIASAIYPVLRDFVPPPVADLGGHEIVAGKVGDLKPNGSKIVRFGTRPALLLMSRISRKASRLPQRICKRARPRSRNAIIAAKGWVLLSFSF